MTVYQHQGSQSERERAEILRTPLLRRDQTKAQVETFIDGNVIGLADAREVLKVLAWSVLVLAKNAR